MGAATTDYQVETCGNCHALLVGDYCHQCGQQNRSYVRGLGSIFRDFFQEFGSWDSRVWRTFKPLLFQPGVLSTEYVAGHRARYVPPVRLYLFVSILFFLVLAVVARPDTDTLRAGLTDTPTVVDGEIVPARSYTERNQVLVGVPWLSDDTRAALMARIDRVAENPDLAFRQARALAPQLMFVLLPLFAVLLKVLYLFSRRYYMEHLVLALHTHSFMFLAFLLMFAFGGVRTLAAAHYIPAWTSTVAAWSIGLLWTWIPIYLFIAQKRFYRQGWILTTIKYLVVGNLYFILITLAFTALVLLSIVTA